MEESPTSKYYWKFLKNVCVESLMENPPESVIQLFKSDSDIISQQSVIGKTSLMQSSMQLMPLRDQKKNSWYQIRNLNRVSEIAMLSAVHNRPWKSC